ncbi:hypothetical protein ACRUK9_27670, partial [Burkholderia pseudomallei]
ARPPAGGAREQQDDRIEYPHRGLLDGRRECARLARAAVAFGRPGRAASNRTGEQRPFLAARAPVIRRIRGHERVSDSSIYGVRRRLHKLC